VLLNPSFGDTVALLNPRAGDNEALLNPLVAETEALLNRYQHKIKIQNRTPDNAEGTVTKLRSWWSGVQIPVGTKDFPLFRTVQNGTGAHPASYLMGTGISSRE
jgi:hypothetical protein